MIICVVYKTPCCGMFVYKLRQSVQSLAKSNFLLRVFLALKKNGGENKIPVLHKSVFGGSMQ